MYNEQQDSSKLVVEGKSQVDRIGKKICNHTVIMNRASRESMLIQTNSML